MIFPVFSFNASETTSFPILQSNSDDDKTVPPPTLPGRFPAAGQTRNGNERCAPARQPAPFKGTHLPEN